MSVNLGVTIALAFRAVALAMAILSIIFLMIRAGSTRNSLISLSIGLFMLALAEFLG